MPYILVAKGKKQEEYDAFHSSAQAQAWAKKMGLKQYEVVYVEYQNVPPQRVRLAPASQSPSQIWSRMKKHHRGSRVVDVKQKNKHGYDKWGRNPDLKAVRRV